MVAHRNYRRSHENLQHIEPTLQLWLESAIHQDLETSQASRLRIPGVVCCWWQQGLVQMHLKLSANLWPCGSHCFLTAHKQQAEPTSWDGPTGMRKASAGLSPESSVCEGLGATPHCTHAEQLQSPLCVRNWGPPLIVRMPSSPMLLLFVRHALGAWCWALGLLLAGRNCILSRLLWCLCL